MTETAYKTQVFDKDNEQLFVETKAEYIIGLDNAIESGVPLKSIKINGQSVTIDANKCADLPAYTKTESDARYAQIATTLSGYGITDAYTKTQVDAKISSVYKPAGSAANVAALGELIAANEGKVYNMSAQFTTTSDFVEGSGKKHPAGTNVVIINTATSGDAVYKYDCLSGYVDLSDYDTHIADTSVHVTSADKTAWNNKQDAITSSNKLDADNVDDTNSTNKFVTSTEKSTWNNKQDAISDLETIRTGAGKGATAVQPADLDNVLRFVKVAVNQ